MSESEASEKAAVSPRRGPRVPCCPQCGSSETIARDRFGPGPSVLFTILIGWLYLLPRAAFVPKQAYCEECGESFTYRSIGSNVALVVLILLVALIVWSGIEGEPSY